MLKKLIGRLKEQRGLTLVELLAVVVILGIISAIAVPSIGGIIDKSKYDAIKADGLSAINAAQLYYLQNPNGDSVTINQLIEGGYLDTKGTLRETDTVSNSLQLNAVGEKSPVKITFTDATKKQIDEHVYDKDNKGNLQIPSQTP